MKIILFRLFVSDIWLQSWRGNVFREHRPFLTVILKYPYYSRHNLLGVACEGSTAGGPVQIRQFRYWRGGLLVSLTCYKEADHIFIRKQGYFGCLDQGTCQAETGRIRLHHTCRPKNPPDSYPGWTSYGSYNEEGTCIWRCASLDVICFYVCSMVHMRRHVQ